MCHFLDLNFSKLEEGIEFLIFIISLKKLPALLYMPNSILLNEDEGMDI